MDRPLESLDTNDVERALRRLAPSMRQYLGEEIPAHLRAICDVEDILQDTWSAAFEYLPTFQNRHPAGLNAWLASILEHKLREAIRRARAQKRGGEHQTIREGDGLYSSVIMHLSQIAGIEATPSKCLANAEINQKIAEAIARLNADDAELIRLRCLEDLTRREIAERLGMSEESVKYRLAQATAELRRLLGGSGLWFADD